MDISFFIVKPPPSRKPGPEAIARAGLSKWDRAAIAAYFAASPTERKAILRDQANAEKKAALDARRAWRRGYQRQYREMRLIATLIL